MVGFWEMFQGSPGELFCKVYGRFTTKVRHVIGSIERDGRINGGEVNEVRETP